MIVSGFRRSGLKFSYHKIIVVQYNIVFKQQYMHACMHGSSYKEIVQVYKKCITQECKVHTARLHT